MSVLQGERSDRGSGGRRSLASSRMDLQTWNYEGAIHKQKNNAFPKRPEEFCWKKEKKSCMMVNVMLLTAPVVEKNNINHVPK